MRLITLSQNDCVCLYFAQFDALTQDWLDSNDLKLEKEDEFYQPVNYSDAD